jgi:hypothetical protein
MNQETTDQGWQKIQSRINQLVGQFLKDDYPSIEYKTHITGLLQLPPEYDSQNIEEIT